MLSPLRVCVYGVVGFIVILQLMYVCMYVGEGSCVRVEYLISCQGVLWSVGVLF